MNLKTIKLNGIIKSSRYKKDLIRKVTVEDLKAEIKKCMEQGMTYEEALREWDLV